VILSRLSNRLAAAHPEFRGLFFVEGIGQGGSPTPPQWGGDLRRVAVAPISFPGNPSLNSRVVGGCGGHMEEDQGQGPLAWICRRRCPCVSICWPGRCVIRLGGSIYERLWASVC
jgi:hypothetical protein